MTSNTYSIDIRRDDDHCLYPQPGKRFGYAYWMQPVLKANDGSAMSGNADVALISSEESVVQQPTPTPEPVPEKRGRGRPRVNKARDETALEKRRAQVREAQRTYQKRKDTAAASERRRGDDILEAMSDLSTNIEALLQTAARTGALAQHGELADHIRQLWDSYDSAINKPCLKPELRLLQVKNDRRRTEYRHSQMQNICSTQHQLQGNQGMEQVEERDEEHDEGDEEVDASQMEFGRIEDSSLMQSFAQMEAKFGFVGQGKTVTEYLHERRTAGHAEESNRST
ncbi:hypothetical protein P280DRAFT_511308 [Massarina eburnea CBS 473.64]|uniref:BZIP domain-containing protein n=1 Tax=Massarina eburnea CBS 473.64 TaxID=1395130 RepID=A0A6A6RI60_9PLEO|nr:hypothetical protein P280DRAFT_511308 [Massarina eburnea CBS 473.64]